MPCRSFDPTEGASSFIRPGLRRRRGICGRNPTEVGQDGCKPGIARSSQESGIGQQGCQCFGFVIGEAPDQSLPARPPSLRRRADRADQGIGQAAR